VRKVTVLFGNNHIKGKCVRNIHGKRLIHEIGTRNEIQACAEIGRGDGYVNGIVNNKTNWHGVV
jgi:hypothetical protein